MKMRNFAAGMLAALAVFGACGDDDGPRARDLYVACVEAAGGTVGDVTVETDADGRIVLVQGPVDAPAEVADGCVETVNEQVAGG